MRVSTVAIMRELDQRAIKDHGIPGRILMEHAGHEVYGVLRETLGVLAGRRVVIICGVGNNGGDGLVVARKLYSAGAGVDVFIYGDLARQSDDSRQNRQSLEGCGVPLVCDVPAPLLARALSGCDAVVDALLGTGIDREVSGRYREVIELINSQGAPVYAVDIPSGVNGDSGRIMGVAVKANHTITFGLPKQGNLLQPGAERAGQLYLTTISFPPELQSTAELKTELLEPVALPARPVHGHKGSFGDVLFIAGARGYYGAPVLAATAFLRAGGGYSRLAAPLSVIDVVAPGAREVVFHPQSETNEGTLAEAALPALEALIERVDMVVLGPGLSLNGQTQNLVRELVPSIEKPLLIDGDGLTALAAASSFPRATEAGRTRPIAALVQRTAPTILTPHLGEMARISGCPVDEIAADPIGHARSFAVTHGVHLVLKGARSLTSTPDGWVAINPGGNSGMGTAGSGDVLTGTVAAMFGLGLSIADAVSTGVFIHGFAGDLAAEANGQDGMVAGDILAALPSAVRAYRDRRDQVFGATYYRTLRQL